MDPLDARLAAQGGVAAVSQLCAIGVTPQMVQSRVRRGDLVRIRRDAVVDGPLWNSSPPWDRHALRARAVALSCRGFHDQPGVALSHHSALSILGIPVFGVDDLVHMVRTDGRRGRTGTGLRVHAAVDPTEVIAMGDVQVVRGPLASLQVADAFGVEAGLVSADAVLRRGAGRADLERALRVGRYGRGTAAARVVVEQADGRMESAGESRARWVMQVCGLPEPEPQMTVRARSGRSARVDFCFRRQRTVVEFDGMRKYQSEQDLRAEKRREDWLRELGYEVVRLTWADLADPERVRSLILAAFDRAARRSGP